MMVVTVVETAVLLVLCILVAGLLRAYATVLQRLHDLDGRRAPEFRTATGVPSPPADRATGQQWSSGHDVAGTGLHDEILSVTMGGGQDTVLVFLSSGCAGCTGFWRDLAHRRELALLPTSRLLVVTKGPGSESVALLQDLCPPGVDLVMSDKAWADYDVPGSPYVVVVDGRSGQVKGEGSGTSLTQVSGLVHQSLGDVTAASDGPRAKPRADADREVDVDRVLLAAGISPGHPSLYPIGIQDVTPAARGLGAR